MTRTNKRWLVLDDVEFRFDRDDGRLWYCVRYWDRTIVEIGEHRTLRAAKEALRDAHRRGALDDLIAEANPRTPRLVEQMRAERDLREARERHDALERAREEN